MKIGAGMTFLIEAAIYKQTLIIQGSKIFGGSLKLDTGRFKSKKKAGLEKARLKNLPFLELIHGGIRPIYAILPWHGIAIVTAT